MKKSPGAVDVGDYRVQVAYENRLPANHPPIGGLVVQSGPQEFLVAGYGFGCRFQAKTATRQTSIQSVELGRIDEGGKWVHGFGSTATRLGRTGRLIPPNTSNDYLGAARPMILRVKVFALAQQIARLLDDRASKVRAVGRRLNAH